MVYFRSAFYTPEDSGLAFRDFNYTRLSLDLPSASIHWNLQEKMEVLGIIDLGIVTDGAGSSFPEIFCRLVMEFPRQDSRGELLILQGGTRIALVFPGNSQGNVEVSESFTILSFRFVDGAFYWRSSKNSKTYTISDPFVTLYLSPDGIDDEDWTTPFQDPNQLIRVLRNKGNFTTGIPDVTNRFGSDRYIGAEILAYPGQYNATWFWQYIDFYGINVIGMGDSPEDVVFYGHDKNEGIKMAGALEINFKNITINSNNTGVYMLHCHDINFEDCRFILRNPTPRNVIFCSRGSRVVLGRQIQLDSASNFRRFVNSSYDSSVEINCNLVAVNGNTLNFSDSFLFADAEARIYAEPLTIGDGTILQGLAAAVRRGGRIYAPPEEINNLIYM